MKTIEKLKKNQYICWTLENRNDPCFSMSGTIIIQGKYKAEIVISISELWESVSVIPIRRDIMINPEELRWVREQIFENDETVHHLQPNILMKNKGIFCNECDEE